MRRLEWAATVRVLSLLVTAFLFAGAVLQMVISFELTGGPPPPPLAHDPIQEFTEVMAWDYGRWPMEFAATALLALGFMGFGGLGVLLARLGESSDARRRLSAAAFIGAGVIGATAMLLWIGVKPIATNPHYCDCGLRAEEIMSRLMIMNVAGAVQHWMVIGALVLVAVGVPLAAGLGREAGMSQAWVWLGWAITVVSLAAVVLSALNISPAPTPEPQLPFDFLAVMLIAGILVPIWSLWLAIRAPMLEGPTLSSEVSDGG